MSVFEELVKSKAFYVLGSDIFSDKDYRVKQEWIDKIAIKCFFARAENAFEYGYINIEEARKLIKNGKLHMDVPQKYMGMMIGKGGAKIKELQDKLAKALEYDGDIRIIMHPQKEGKTITIEQLKSAIRENEKN